MLTILANAVTFAIANVATDRFIPIAKKGIEQLNHRRIMRKYGIKPQFNYAPLFGG